MESTPQNSFNSNHAYPTDLSKPSVRLGTSHHISLTKKYESHPIINQHHPPSTFREHLCHALESETTVKLIVALLVFELLTTMAELVLSMVFYGDHHHTEEILILEAIFWATSMVVVSVLLLEILLSIFAFGFTYLKKTVHLIDLLFTVTTFAVMIYFFHINPQEAEMVSAFLSVLRLWRALQLMKNSTLIAFKMHDLKMEELVYRVHELETELDAYKFNRL